MISLSVYTLEMKVACVVIQNRGSYSCLLIALRFDWWWYLDISSPVHNYVIIIMLVKGYKIIGRYI